MSASTAVNAASCAHCFRTWLQTHIFRIESNGTVFPDIAWDAHITDGLRFIERRMGIPEIQKLFQVTHVLSDINHFEIGIAFDLLFHIFAVGAGVHYVHLYHSHGVFSLARQIYIFSTRLIAGVVSIVIPGYAERWGYELDKYKVYARFVLIDTVTGYGSQSQDYSTIISAIS